MFIYIITLTIANVDRVVSALAATIVYVRYYCLCSVTIGHAC